MLWNFVHNFENNKNIHVRYSPKCGASELALLTGEVEKDNNICFRANLHRQKQGWVTKRLNAVSAPKNLRREEK